MNWGIHLAAIYPQIGQFGAVHWEYSYIKFWQLEPLETITGADPRSFHTDLIWLWRSFLRSNLTLRKDWQPMTCLKLLWHMKPPRPITVENTITSFDLKVPLAGGSTQITQNMDFLGVVTDFAVVDQGQQQLFILSLYTFTPNLEILGKIVLLN